jgi:hypothetical protein
MSNKQRHFQMRAAPRLHRLQLRMGRNAMAIYQDLVYQHGFGGAFNSVKRFVAPLRHKAPEQFDRMSFLPGEEVQVDYCEGAPTRVVRSCWLNAFNRAGLVTVFALVLLHKFVTLSPYDE